ncbi:MAG: aldo/keto reductase [Betaproteobacteria bacterium]
MNLSSKLGLGTVQWGMSYGIANKSGPPELPEVRRILELARKFGVNVLDTAHAYGNAEQVIGMHQELLEAYNIVTKTLPIQAIDSSKSSVSTVLQAFDESMVRLGRTNIYGLLVHREDDLLSSYGKKFWQSLQELKAQGAVSKIGLSVYEPNQLARILDCYPIDLVQLPLNLYDQRFLRSGMIERLSLSGVEVHIRSSFLQGLLLLPTDHLPDQFSSIRAHHSRFRQECKTSGTTPLEASLRFCLAQPKVNKVIVGCETQTQMQGILGAASGSNVFLGNTESFALEDDDLAIDPRRWVK